MKKATLLLTLIASALSFAQNTGSIVGKLTDKEYNNEPLAFGNVLIKGTTKGTTSDFDGLYQIENLNPGEYTLVFSFVGYETQEITATVVAGKVTEVNVPMGASAASLDEIVITTTTKRESITALLLEQKNAVEIKQSIGAQELSRKGVSDAEGAVSKVSGVSKSEGSKNVFVRGLGDRYNSTSLNGLPLPSEDPEYKNIALDFFTSDIIESVGINKVFNSSIYGDLGGANIDIVSKEMSGKSIAEISISSGFNANAIDSEFLTPNGSNIIGTSIDNEAPINDLSQYSFQDGFRPDAENNPLNFGGSIKLGKRFDIKDSGNSLSAFLNLSASNSYQFREGLIAGYNNFGDQGTDQTSEESVYSTTQLGILNLKYKFGNNNTIALNNGLIRKVNQFAGEYIGENARVSDNLEDEDFIRRQQVNKNNLYVNQVLTKFNLSEQLMLNVNGSYNLIRGSEPDRRTNSFIRRTADNEDFFRVTAGSAGLNHRFYSTLEEDDIAGQAYITYKFLNDNEASGEDKNKSLTIGANYRSTERNFTFRQFNFQFNGQERVEINNPDLLFNQTNIDNGLFEIITDRGRNASALVPFLYLGARDTYAGYTQGVYTISENLLVTAGIRFENINQQVDWDTSLTSSIANPNTDNAVIEETYFLPNASVKYNFTENSVLRIAGSLSYILPQYKEVAPFLYEEVNFSSFGNPFLNPSNIFNIDAKYDYFFSSGELISITGFYKSIKDPINRIQVNSAGNDFSYVNVGDATVAGLELELRKDILNKEISDTKKSNLQFGLNASYLYSNQKLVDVGSDELTVRFTNSEDALEGASPLLLNTDITYNFESTDFKITSSIVGNYFSDRIFSLGTAGNANFVEQSRITLDFINKVELNKHLSLSFNIKNIIDPRYEITQDILGEDLPISTYRRGINSSLGVSYKF